MALKHRTLVSLVTSITWIALSTTLFSAPPAEIEWKPLPELSDEFDTHHGEPSDDGLDRTKWWDFHPTWTGRLPSQFSAENTWIEDGKLKLRSSVAAAPSSPEHNVDSAVITSRAEAQPGDYFEASIQVADLSMPSSWWFNQGAKSEIDVIENIGRPENPHQSFRQTKMAYNTHFFEDPDDIQTVGSEGPQSQQLGQMVDGQGEPLVARDEFITYAVWWKSPTEIRFYYNDNEVARVTPRNAFDEGLNMLFDMEVFSWAGEPTIASLGDSTKNTMQVDWVRGYRPVANAGPPSNMLDNPGFEQSELGEPSRPGLWSDCGKETCGDDAPFESRSNETAHTGEWSLKVDNRQPGSFGQYKELRPRDNVISVLPGETIQHELWVKLTEPLAAGDETLAVAIRLNGDNGQPRAGAGRVSLADGTVLAEFPAATHARELNINTLLGGEQLNQWVKIEHELEIPATDSKDQAVHFIAALTYLDNKTDAPDRPGTLFFDDFSLEVFPAAIPGDFDGDGDVDGEDFLRWQKGQSPRPLSNEDLQEWKNNQGSVPPALESDPIPEPTAICLVVIGAGLYAAR